ncbi:MAG: hypothetical protein KJT01_07215 [Gemmatimonadetes bacterium]|nr:hypothetical protein [Gemmatimonadota bacterium]
MRTHVKIVALLNLFHSLVGVLAAIGILLGGTFAAFITFDPFAFLAGTAVSVVAALVVGAISGLSLLASLALLNHARWARTLVLVLSVVRLFKWPWGTFVGGYSLWVLTHQETKALFGIAA